MSSGSSLAASTSAAPARSSSERVLAGARGRRCGGRRPALQAGGSGHALHRFGDDELGHRAKRELEGLGLRVEAAFRPKPQRRGFVHIDQGGERTITVIGERMGPRGDDPLPWASSARPTPSTSPRATAPRHSRRAGRERWSRPSAGSRRSPRRGSSSTRWWQAARDPGERYSPGDLDPSPLHVVRTGGAGGGEFESLRPARSGRWAATPLPGPVSDAYGCGDSFAAGLTYGLGSGRPIDEAVLVAARCGAACLTGRGPYQAQLRSAT